VVTYEPLATAEKGTVEWEALNPMAEYETPILALSPKLANLNEKTVGLFWNGKPNGDLLLKAIGKLLEQRFKNIRTIKFNLSVSVGPESRKQMAEQCDAVIAAIGD
jgi:hypothetical protein